MNRNAVIMAASALVLAAGFAGLGYTLGRRAQPAPAAQPAAAEAKRNDAGRKILYWHDPMSPQQRFDKPGKSPFMDMDLVPVYADDVRGDGGDQGGVSVSPRVQQSLGVRTAAAEPAEFKPEINAVGYVQVDERRIARAEVRTQGWVEKLRVRAVNDPVRAGQPLAEIYSPDLYSAQEEYLLALRLAKENPADATLAQAARGRLLGFGMSSSAIAKLAAEGKARRRMPIVAPISGVLTELGVREGQMVQPGMAAFTVTDLSSVWITVEVHEAQAGVLREGLSAVASVASYPGKTFTGRVDYIYPEVNPQTRTVKARVVLANTARQLKPGMFANVALAGSARRALAVPTEAVIQTGTRSVVVVAEGERFRAAAVRIGAEADGRSEVLEGLKAGERVVVSGQFLIDSEASLRTALTRLEGEAQPAAVPASLHHGRGKVTDVHIAKGRVEIEHGPIASLKWPGMTMEFVVEDSTALAHLKRGEEVEFELRGEPDQAGDYVITRIGPAASAPASAPSSAHAH